MPYPATNTLNQNKVTSALFNMIISQQVFDSSVASTELADMFRVDGTLFGDKKLYYSFDYGTPEDWLGDSEAPDLLKLNRNKSAKIQSIEMGVYKIISITTDRYLSKQAFSREGTFAEYTSFLLGSLRKIKRVYDRSLINVTLGTLSPSTDKCKLDIVTPKGTTIEETNRLEAQTLARTLAIFKTNIEDNSRDYNKFGFLRSYDINDMVAVWNVEKETKITKLDLPTIFHTDINPKGGFNEYRLPKKWFGDVATAELNLETEKNTDNKNRILQSGWYDVSDTYVTLVPKPDEEEPSNTIYLWAGDEVPYTGQVYEDFVRKTNVTVISTKMKENTYYIVNEDIAFVLVHKSALPYMSGFETGTEFWNSRSLTNNNYLIFGHNNLEFLEEYPRIKVTIKQEA